MEGGKRELNYWPGFVDALSGLTLALVLVMIIFVVAMFSFAAQLANKKAELAVEEARTKFAASTEANAQLNVVAIPKSATDFKEAEKITELQRQVDKLKGLLRQTEAKHASETVESTKKEVTADEGGGVSVREPGSGSIVVHFSAGNVALTPDARTKLERALTLAAKSTPDATTYDIEASFGSETYSEARRNAYFRLMAIRNLLVERNVSPTRIDSRIADTSSGERAGESSVVIRLKRK